MVARELGLEHALAAGQAGKLAAKLQVAVDANALVDGRLREAMHSLGLREVMEGARIEFSALSKFSLSLAREFHGLPVASPPCLYAELQALGGRGEEAAEHARQELIRI